MISFRRVLYGVGGRFRKRRFDRFLTLAAVRAGDRILDVGGWPDTWDGSGLEHQVTILNPIVPDPAPGPFTWVHGDARDMSVFADKAFDIGFSNSVIEHVGTLADQHRMALELRRVCRRYWVQTPNLHFPIEPHFVFPAFQYLPTATRRWIALRWPLSWPKVLGLDPLYEESHVRLLTGRELAVLFDDAEIMRERFCGLTKSLVAHTLGRPGAGDADARDQQSRSERDSGSAQVRDIVDVH